MSTARRPTPSIHLRPSLPPDAEALAPRLRAADLREIQAATALDPRTILTRGIALSDPCHTVVDDGTVIALFGAVPSARHADLGIVWLLASDDLTAHTRFIVRESRAWLARLHERYRVLANHVDARNEVHLRWLRWCGFTFVRRVERHGAEGRPFYEVRHESDQGAGGR